MVRDGLWTKLRRTVGSIDFAREAVAAWHCARDPKTPARVKAILIGAAVFWAAWKAVSGHITEGHRE